MAPELDAAIAASPVRRPADTRAWVRAPARGLAWALAGLVFALALAPRVLDTDRFVTTDELFWIGRAANFADALATGRLAQTIQSGHPGVTTMWTAALGMGPSRARDLSGGRREISRREVSEHPSFLPGLASARRAFGLLTAGGVALAALLAWRLFGPSAALLGGCLLALDPFLLAHSRLVHVDASLAVWMTLAVLAALARLAGGGPAMLALAGVATGLALLSKAPGLFLLGFIPLTALMVGGRAVICQASLRDLVVWAGLAGATYLALWPALWVAPGETLGQVFGFVRDNANPSHAAAADAGSGPWFYPLVLALRSTPLTWAGLGLLLVWRPTGPAARASAALAVFGLGFTLLMTVAAKNFDRYLLPVFPALDLLAGLGLSGAVARLFPSSASPARRAAATAACAAALVALSAAWVAGSWPYVLTYANPLAGGPATAHALVASGWGEGLDRVAAYLNGQPNAGRLKVGMPGEIYTTVLGAQFRGQVAPAEGGDAGAYDYVVVYTRNVQLGERPAFFDERFLPWTPEATVSLGGVDYAWIYRAAAGAPVGAAFGDLVVLEGYGLDAATVRPGRRLEARLRWRPLQPLPPDLRLVVELRPPGDSGPIVAHDTPLQSSEVGPWEPGTGTGTGTGSPVTGLYTVPLRADLTPGPYVLAVRVLDPNGRPLPLTRPPPLGPAAVAESDAVALRGIQVR